MFTAMNTPNAGSKHDTYVYVYNFKDRSPFLVTDYSSWTQDQWGDSEYYLVLSVHGNVLPTTFEFQK